MVRILSFLILSLLVHPLWSQRDQGFDQIASTLDSMNLEFFTPVESEVRFLKPRENAFFEYDSRIKVRSNDMEVLIAFHQDTSTNPIATFYPHLEFNRLLNNLVSNDYDQDVLVIGWRKQKLKLKNADWGAEAYIKPRQEISTYPFAKLISFYREEEGLVIMLYCFNKPDFVPELLSFKEVVN